MTPDQIEILLKSRFSKVEVVNDRWEAAVGNLRLVVMAHHDTDRLRIMVPVAAVDHPDAATFRRLLEANFITTLDARYGIYGDVLWAIFLAPLSGVSEHLFDTAVSEVLQLAANTGTSYCAWPSGMTASFAHLH